MVSRSCIPGVDEAVAKEHKLRVSAFVSNTDWICGIEVKHITPYLLALLQYIESPFVVGGIPSVAHAAQFLLALSPNRSYSRESIPEFTEELTMKILDLGEEGVDILYSEISDFLESTFFDSPTASRGDSVPYVCSVAYLIYKMQCKPHQMTRDEAGNTPIRQIHQFIRCAQYERGDIMFNQLSDTIKATWLEERRNKQSGGDN